jgi:hypothetical protein
MDEQLVQEILRDPDEADISPALRETLRLLKRLTLAPGEFGPGDVAPALELGVAPAAIEDALMVCFVFSVIIRFIDAFGCPSKGPAQRASLARALMGLGYSLGAVPGRSRPGPRPQPKSP